MRGMLLTGVMMLSGLLLTGCGQDRVRVALPPVELTECAEEPLVPDLPGREDQARRDAMTLEYLLSLRSAWGDCKSRVAGLKGWRESME